MEWIDLLHGKVNQLGRRQVEADTSLSKTTLSLVLNNKYPGNLSNIEAKVRAAYTAATVTCPILDSIPIKRCHSEQGKPFTTSNPQRVKLFRACMNCPNKKSS